MLSESADGLTLGILHLIVGLSGQNYFTCIAQEVEEGTNTSMNNVTVIARQKIVFVNRRNPTDDDLRNMNGFQSKTFSLKEHEDIFSDSTKDRIITQFLSEFPECNDWNLQIVPESHSF